MLKGSKKLSCVIVLRVFVESRHCDLSEAVQKQASWALDMSLQWKKTLKRKLSKGFAVEHHTGPSESGITVHARETAIIVATVTVACCCCCCNWCCYHRQYFTVDCRLLLVRGLKALCWILSWGGPVCCMWKVPFWGSFSAVSQAMHWHWDYDYCCLQTAIGAWGQRGLLQLEADERLSVVCAKSLPPGPCCFYVVLSYKL